MTIITYRNAKGFRRVGRLIGYRGHDLKVLHKAGYFEVVRPEQVITAKEQ